MPTSDPRSHLLCVSSDPDIALLGQQMALTLHATPLLQVPPGQATETKTFARNGLWDCVLTGAASSRSVGPVEVMPYCK